MLPALVATQLTTAATQDFHVYIGGRELTSVVKWDSFHTEDGSLNSRGRTTLRIEGSPVDYPEIRPNALLTVYDYNRDRHFVRAYVTSVKPERTPGYTFMSVNAADITGVLDDTLVVYETRRTVESFRARLGRFVGNYLHAYGHVSPDLSLVEELGDALPAQVYAGMTLTEVIETLISQSDHPDATYYIDAEGRLRVHDLSGAAAPYNISDVPGDPVDTGARTEVTHGGLHDAFPGLARAGNGDLVLVYRTGANHSAGGPLNLQISSDNGESWGPVMEIEDVVGGPNIARTSANTLIISYRWSDTALYVRRSTDNGRTWSSRILATTAGTDGGGHPTAAIVQAPNGDLLLPYYTRDTTETYYSSEYVRSTDDGLTWGARQLIGDGPTDSRDYFEPCIVLSGTTLICLTRTDSDNIFRRFTSTNSGTSWTAQGAAVNLATGRPAMTVETSGKIFLNHRHVPLVAGEAQRGVWRRSSDNGATWTAEEYLDPDDDDLRTVYGWAVQVPDGPLVIAYGLEGPGDTAATEADIYVRRFEGEVVPQYLLIDSEVTSYANSVMVRGANPESTLEVTDPEAIADANRLVRTRELSAPDVDTAAKARALGNMYLGRVSPTKQRGRFIVNSPYDGWRAGQFVSVTDSELDVDNTFRITGVDTTVLRPGNDPLFRYEVDFTAKGASE